MRGARPELGDATRTRAHPTAAPGGIGPPVYRVGGWRRVANTPFVAGIWAYRLTLSWLLGRQCRFYPTCSRYGLDAYAQYGPWRATVLTVKRIGRCHPWSEGGYDPVPVPPHAPGGSRRVVDDGAGAQGLQGASGGAASVGESRGSGAGREVGDR